MIAIAAWLLRPPPPVKIDPGASADRAAFERAFDDAARAPDKATKDEPRARDAGEGFGDDAGPAEDGR